MRRDSSLCAKSVRYNIFTNGTPLRIVKTGSNNHDEAACSSILQTFPSEPTSPCSFYVLNKLIGMKN